MQEETIFLIGALFLMMPVELLCAVQNITNSTFCVLCGSFELFFKNGNNFLSLKKSLFFLPHPMSTSSF